jgi:serine/threonine-protein phosphatase PGAM5
MLPALLALLALTLAAPAARCAESAPKPAGVRYLYLIRHGMYDRVEHADDRVANGLDSLGREQARLIGARLTSLPVPMTSLVSSDLTRARETADLIGRALHMTAECDSLLRECTPAAERADYMKDHSHEDVALCDSQLVAAWEKYARPSPAADARDVLVCHANVIRWFVSRALGLDTRNWSRMDIANGSLTVIAVRADGSTRLAAFSDGGHLPVPRQTWTGRGAGWTVTPDH